MKFLLELEVTDADEVACALRNVAEDEEGRGPLAVGYCDNIYDKYQDTRLDECGEYVGGEFGPAPDSEVIGRWRVVE